MANNARRLSTPRDEAVGIVSECDNLFLLSE